MLELLGNVIGVEEPPLDVPADATAAYIGFMVRMQSLGKAELMGVYGR